MWRAELLQALIPPDPASVQVGTAFALKQAHIPASIFKLRTVSEFSLANLQDDTIWVSSADEFNDPFDSAHSINASTVYSAQPLEKKIEAYRAAGQLADFTEAEIQAVREHSDPRVALVKLVSKGTLSSIGDSELHELLDQRGPQRLSDRYQLEMKKFQKGTKVSCFTTKNRSVVMWSHYANYHRGFSVEYDLAANPRSPLAQQVWPVIYRQQLFDATSYLVRAVQGQDCNRLVGFLAALNKSPEWEYEDEWRVVAPLGDAGSSFNMSVPTPKAIYLGARISPAHKSLLVNLARRKSIPVFQMTMALTEFSLVPHAVVF